jgi:hypothetical protein
MQVFEVVRHWAPEPVTIFAKNEEEARAIYRRWIEAHHDGRPFRPTTIYPFSEQQLTDRPVLAAAAGSNTLGVGYWDRRAERWRIAPPDVSPLGDLVEHEPGVRYYEFTTDEGDFTMVFAESVEHATTLYCAYKLHGWKAVPQRFAIRHMSRWDLKGEHVTLRDDMHAELWGIGLPDNRGIWRIQPPEHNWGA